ncbi:MAG: branched-chain amino acid ABC transporter substrate-binding protein [Chloroflexota bacterium]
MSTSRKTSLVFLLVALLLVVLNSVAFAQDDVIKVAIMGPFTGPAASIGTEQLNWAQLAVDDFNEATGWSVELVQGDTQLDPSVAVTVAESLIADPEIYGVVGPAGSGEVEATGQMFADAGLVQIANSATRPSLTEHGWTNFFRVVPNDNFQGPTVGNFLAHDLGVTSLYIIDDQTSYAVTLADLAVEAFEGAGGTVTGRQSVTQDDTDFSSLITVIGASGAEAVFFPGQIASQGALFAQQMVEQGVSFILFGADGFQSQSDFIDGAAGAAEGAYVSSFAPDVHDLESSADVVARFNEQYDTGFSTFGPPSYAATQAILEAIWRASDMGDLTRETVAAEVANTDIELSVLGTPLAFDEHGEVLNGASYIFQVQDGGFVYVPSATDMEATPEASS